MSSNESDLLPKARDVTYYDQNSDLAKELQFVSALCKTTNCRESLDAWDCPICAEILPDAIVVRSFRTHPNDVTGQVVRSESYWSKMQLVDHPFIPDIRVQEGCLEAAMDIRSILRNTLKDQLTLFPDYKTAVIGGNFKAYLMAKSRIGDYNYAKYVAKQDIKILRIHEGDEYWLKYFNDGELLLTYRVFGIQQSCYTDDGLHFNFTALMERLSSNIELASEEIQRAQEASKNQMVSQILL
ncbi:hypothetical protein RO3G_04814 [Rhizopus delemar RA 99-880]|uniref:Uncharacterized protein n=1 Tax=Rhizopus delemar (strain RA 99-880 / ATCC MYA-4621 / FGSC 9543 / NRRL 43880) TaxID=246409 RepID=I1BV79_RHIO9|nr:hypothetical protein RO3G_04814 [Rhizopus delemar RA 99-880]|eukprot:EIE80109.1 hypothetical protein RO3G_04814 [Rhizopus delemar RA 99-880]